MIIIFFKEKECREIALKSTADLTVKIKHTRPLLLLGWMVVLSLYMNSSLISKYTTQVYEHLAAPKFPAFLPNDSMFALLFLWKVNPKGIFWLHFSHW